ncbi:MAG TPA: ShlB/FhaC/HecB family hemolysin secretion/activation protein [Trichocoleus sp.]
MGGSGRSGRCVRRWGTVPGLLVSSLLLNPPVGQAIAPETVLFAQTSPAESNSPGSDFLQPIPVPSPIAPAEQIPVLPVSPVPPLPQPISPPVTIPVQRIEVIGSTVFSEADFAPILQPHLGQSLTLEELRQVADAVTQLYLDRGYITSRAILVDQTIQNGLVQIRVIEGKLEAIEIEGTRRVNPAYIRSRVRLGGNTPLNQADLEDQLRLLRIDPLFDNVEASLRAGSGLGQSILTVRVTEASAWILDLSVDNLSPPDVGSERTGAVLGTRNLTGNGDALTAAYYRSTTGGSHVFDFAYQVPLNAMNGTILLRYSPSSFEITNPEFAAFDIQGSANLYEVSLRQPLIRSPRTEFALSLGFSHRTGQTFVSQLLTDDSTTSVVSFGQDYVRRDPQGAWVARSQFNFGTGLFNATVDENPDGLFFSWLGQAQRVQILDQSNLLIAQLDVQLTPDPLLPAQQFVIGGGQSVRGYRQNARTGDNGIRFSVEDRLALQRNETGNPTLQLAPFIDLGAVWNAKDNPTLFDQNFLAGVGLGLIWEPVSHLTLRLDGAVPLVNLDDRGKNAQDYGFYFSVNYQLE